jgi:hypothetical protein
VISTSKIKKIIEIKKNRIENGIREESIGSNPHSKGEVFSRSRIVFFEIKREILITIILIKKITKIISSKFKIIYTKIFRPINWKLIILFILYKF